MSKLETGSNMEPLARRNFFGLLGGLFQSPSALVRPPYALSGEDYTRCTLCEGMCVTACEEKIVFREESGKPYIDFKKSGCSNCQLCMDACIPNVLVDPSRFIVGRARINTMACMSHHETICFSCKDPCADNAIHFEGMFRPIIFKDQCTACGFCVSMCPSGAIEVIV